MKQMFLSLSGEIRMKIRKKHPLTCEVMKKKKNHPTEKVDYYVT